MARAAAVTCIHDAALLETLADAAVRAMPQLSAADICSVVESFSGGQGGDLGGSCGKGTNGAAVAQRACKGSNVCSSCARAHPPPLLSLHTEPSCPCLLVPYTPPPRRPGLLLN